MSAFFVSITTGLSFDVNDKAGENAAFISLAALEDAVHIATNLRPCLGGGRISHHEVTRNGFFVDGVEVVNHRPRLGFFVSTMAEVYAIIRVAPRRSHSIVAYHDTNEEIGTPMHSRFIAGTGKWSTAGVLAHVGRIPTGHLPVFNLDTGGTVTVMSVDV